MSPNIKSTVEAMVTPYLQEHGFELVDIEYVKEGSNWFLRVYIDKEGGIDIDECGQVSEYLSAKLDEKDPISGAYFLEVSSPGAERPLKKPADFKRAVGKYVFVTTYEPVDGLKEFEGTLEAYEPAGLTVSVGKRKHMIPQDKMASARLAIKF